MAVALSEAAGGNGEGVPLPAGVAATAANGRQKGDTAEGVLVVGSMATRAEGVPVIDLTAVAEEEEEKKDHSRAYARRESRIDLTAPAEEEGEDEKERQGVDGPRAEGVPVMDLTEESSEEEEQEELRWVGQYSSTQSILLVGDGDFSFSLALATGFGSGANLVATSLDSYDTLTKKYSGAESNLAELKKMGAVTLHGVNAKTMKLHTDLKMRRFDKVIFNLPHAGFKGKEFSPFSPALPLLVPEMPQPYVPFHMPSVPVFSEFFVHEAVPWWYPPADAGCIPQPIGISYTAGNVPWCHPWHRYPWTWGSSW